MHKAVNRIVCLTRCRKKATRPKTWKQGYALHTMQTGNQPETGLCKTLRVLSKLIFLAHYSQVFSLASALKKKAMKPKSWKQGLSQTTENYASRTSIHGIGYIFDWDLSFADRLLWTIFTLSFLALAILLTWNNSTQWQKNQVKTLPMCPTAFCKN